MSNETIKELENGLSRSLDLANVQLERAKARGNAVGVAYWQVRADCARRAQREFWAWQEREQALVAGRIRREDLDWLTQQHHKAR